MGDWRLKSFLDFPIPGIIVCHQKLTEEGVNREGRKLDEKDWKLFSLQATAKVSNSSQWAEIPCTPCNFRFLAYFRNYYADS